MCSFYNFRIIKPVFKLKNKNKKLNVEEKHFLLGRQFRFKDGKITDERKKDRRMEL